MSFEWERKGDGRRIKVGRNCLLFFSLSTATFSWFNVPITFRLQVNSPPTNSHFGPRRSLVVFLRREATVRMSRIPLCLSNTSPQLFPHDFSLMLFFFFSAVAAKRFQWEKVGKLRDSGFRCRKYFIHSPSQSQPPPNNKKIPSTFTLGERKWDVREGINENLPKAHQGEKERLLETKIKNNKITHFP